MFRRGSEMISQERRNVLNDFDNRNELKRVLKLRKTILLEILEEERVITSEDKKVIKVNAFISVCCTGSGSCLFTSINYDIIDDVFPVSHTVELKT